MIRLHHPEDAETSGSPGLTGLIQDRLQHPGEFYLSEDHDSLDGLVSLIPCGSDPEAPLGLFEWAQLHTQPAVLELTYITDDDGYAVVFFIPNQSRLFHIIKGILSDESRWP